MASTFMSPPANALRAVGSFQHPTRCGLEREPGTSASSAGQRLRRPKSRTKSSDLRQSGRTCRVTRSGVKNQSPTMGRLGRTGPSTSPIFVKSCMTDLRRGTLFALPHDKSWTGRGVTDICAVCNRPIFAAETAQEVIGTRRAHAHLVCYRAWLLESIVVRQSDESSSAESPADSP